MLQLPRGSASKHLLTTAVVHGKVQALSSYWNEDRTRIFTQVTFEVTRVVYGSVGNNSVYIVVEGGTIGTIKTFVTGEPQFVEGEEALLFLRPTATPTNGKMPDYSIVGAIQGKFSVYRDPVTGRTTIRSDAANRQTTLVPDESGLTAPPGGKQGLPLEDFLRQISLLGGQ